METAIAIQRDPELIAAEINHIVTHTRVMVINNSIEIGRRLCEAKECVPHGQWGDWLKEKVDFSTSSANNFMRIFDGYANNQMALFGETDVKNQAFGKLIYTKALALLAIPDEEERAEFIENHDVENMSTRELQRVIKERDQALKDLEDANKLAAENSEKVSKITDEKKQIEDDVADLKKKLEAAEAADNTEEIKSLQHDLEEADKLLESANEEIEELNKKLNEKPIDVPAAEVVEKIPDDVARELEELRAKSKSADAVKFSVQFEVVRKSFESLLGILAEFTDPDEQAKYKKVASGLIGKMAESL